MPAASILIKPSSSNCNMDCKYCFYKCLSSNREQYSMGFMSEQTLETLVKNAVEYADGYLTFAFQGGEPTLRGLDFFRKAIELQKKYNPGNLVIENTMQTNGILINKEWAEFFRDNRFLIGLSLDGTRKLHDGARFDVSGNGTFERVMCAAETLKRYGVDFNILTVVTELIAQKASALYRFYKRNGFSYVQLIPCMNEGGRNQYAVTAESYGRFLCEFFDLWYEDFRKGDIMDVRMFSNLAQMTVGYPPEECGMNGCCSCYFVVEGDGSVYPCDFFCLDEYRLGKVEQGFDNLIQSSIVTKFIDESKQMAAECIKCPYVSLCRGGCRKLRQTFADEGLGKSIFCESYRMFFEHTWERLHMLGRTIIEPGYRV